MKRRTEIVGISSTRRFHPSHPHGEVRRRGCSARPLYQGSMSLTHRTLVKPVLRLGIHAACQRRSRWPPQHPATLPRGTRFHHAVAGPWLV